MASTPKAFDASRGGDLWIAGYERKVKCDRGRCDQAVSAFCNRVEADSQKAATQGRCSPPIAVG